MRRRKKLPYAFKMLIFTVLYACAFSVAAMFGLSKLWDYISAYEISRSQNTIDAYMEQLSVSHMQDYASDLIASIDHNIQSEEACRQAIADALSGGVSYARKLSECTETQQVYMLLSGGKTIGKVTLSAMEADEFGFAPWQVTSESFDFSYLIGKGTTVTVPHDYPVYVNGTQLSEEYIVERDLHYAQIEEFYSTYSLPTMVTYAVDPILGGLNVVIHDAWGNPVTAEDALNQELALQNCTLEELDALNRLTSEYISSYVAFSTNANTDLQGNYRRLLTSIVPGSALAERMEDALNGLKWVGDRNAIVLSTVYHAQVRFLDGHYLCDVTYEVQTDYRNTISTETENIKLIITVTDDGLKVERMIGY